MDDFESLNHSKWGRPQVR